MTKTLICTHCGTRTNRPATITKGNIGLEIVLWMMFLVPGVIYSIWRHTTRASACPACQSTDMIPTATPKGRALLAQNPESPIIDAKRTFGEWFVLALIGFIVLFGVLPMFVVLAFN